MTSSNSDTELLTEHFGYPPVSLIDDIINSVNILAERALNSVEQGLLNAPPAALGFRANNSRQQRQPRDAAAAGEEATDPAEAAKDEIEAGTHQLETLLCASIDRNFDKFEIYVLRNILCVRPADVRDWIRLSHYEGLDFSSSSAAATSSAITGTTSADDATAADGDKEMRENGDGEGIATASPDVPTLEGINGLRRKLRESMRLNALLTAEQARNERLLRDLRRLVGAPADSKVKRESTSTAVARITVDDSSSVPRDDDDAADAGGSGKSPFAFLHRKADLAAEAGPDAPLGTTTAFTLSQMQALRALSASLRTLAPDLAPPPGNSSLSSASASMAVDDGDGVGEAEEGEKNRKKSWRRERLEYVEGAARRHLESVQGLELGRGGEVRDGEWQGGGRSLARGEVEGLERIVSLLGGGGGGAGAGEGAAGEVQGAGEKKGRGGGGDRGGADEDDGADRMDES
ncbi:hypothetical protein DL766_000254 [Monosporascus sp. MC13-8B]|uniref:Mis12 domain-containing protein n=1 Tax=Monosporascus cannonballus TaxID=155416 RepID=A0ABY0H0R5_9PEZI|nr:hypothetical protein DL762_007039 [Monosporascus cannonballus]RYO93077.1 hypothetical protein DL763_004473 [Monosporascus cannonballus]RYP39812.1 hypothetical protein DL766_000254 [Monosporascus sp. MC13-8B]